MNEAACSGCGEVAEPVDLADPAGPWLLAHRGGCPLLPPDTTCTCYDAAAMEFWDDRPCNPLCAHATETETR